MSRIPRKLKKKFKKELKLCKNDAAYFYQKYSTVNGKRPYPLTDRQKELLHKVRAEPMSLNKYLQEYPLTIDECFTWNIQGKK